MRAVHAIYLGTIAASIVVHVALGAGLKRLPERKYRAPTNVAVMTQAKKKPQNKDEQPKDEPPKPVEPPKPIVAAPRNAPKPAAAPPPEAAPPPQAPVADSHVSAPAGPGGHFAIDGLSFGNGGGTLAIPGGGGGGGAGPASSALTSTKAVEKVMKAGAPKSSEAASDGCTEELVKPKAQGGVHAQYTDDARSAGIEGKVTLKLLVDANGNVKSVTVMKGLGHGLDQAAAAAAKGMKFTPGTRCGRPAEAPFIIAVRFALGE